ncbi:MAG: cardiolipin synthase B [Pyrinomonadaceae bacterium]|nr:cardiolipin synthase B [Pyrinomonadaceae bacterium]
MDNTVLEEKRTIEHQWSTSPPYEASLDRITDSKLISGCDLRLLVDASENYPAWLEAIESAEDRIYFESYIIHDDEQGKKFADALIKKAGEGVSVKLIYDWLGGFGKTSRRYWRRLRNGGVEVRCYNPPKLTDPFSILSRDHRKIMTVDGKIAFVSGLCVGQDWVGNPAKDMPAWRDTGVQVKGAAVVDVERAFANIWQEIGEPLDISKLPKYEDYDEEGDVSLRIVDSVPSSSNIYRVDQFLAAQVQQTMWLADAYFIGIPSYLQSIKDVAEDGVDVRILLPRSTDIAIVRDTTRTTYRDLLEAGVRIFEWNGSMMHAKTAVFDGKYSRVGSTNLNVASWFGNYELDVFVEDEMFGRKMQEMYSRDLENSTEIVLADTERKRFHMRKRSEKKNRTRGGSVANATVGAINTATSISSVITQKAPLGKAESRLLFLAGSLMLLIALLFIFFPRAASIPLVVILLIMAFSTLVKAARHYGRRQ